jgi:glycosyltransferase involved in cell wall biosynthesis
MTDGSSFGHAPEPGDSSRQVGRARRRHGERRVLMLLGNSLYPQDDRPRRAATTLTKHGYHVTVVCPRGHGQEADETLDGVHVRRYRLPIRARGAISFVAEHAWVTLASLVITLRLLREAAPDVLHVHNPPDTLVFVSAVLKLLRCTVVFDHHDLAPELYRARFGPDASRWVYRVLVVLERVSCRLADRVIATNESYRTYDIERHNVDPQKIAVIRNGPEIDRFVAVAPDPDVRRGAQLVICYAGVIGPQDGVDYLLRAVDHLVHKLGRTSTRCLVVGDGDAVPGLRAQASLLKIESHVAFTGFVPFVDLVNYVCAADVCVDPAPSNAYNDRSTAIKVMEYLALGRPVVAFDLPEHRVTAGDCAVYVEPNEVEGFADAIAALADDAPRRRELGACGTRRARDELAWDAIAPRLVSMYESLTAPTAVRA